LSIGWSDPGLWRADALWVFTFQADSVSWGIKIGTEEHEKEGISSEKGEGYEDRATYPKGEG
jgi:hypothetical protein